MSDCALQPWGLPLPRCLDQGLFAKPTPFYHFSQNEMGVTAVLILPLLLLGISGLLFIYQEVSRLWSKSAVQNKVVVITDAISGLGKGKLASPLRVPTPALRDEQWRGGMWPSLPGGRRLRLHSFPASVINQQVSPLLEAAASSPEK